MEQSPNILVLDAGYKPFPSFAEWSGDRQVDVARWDRYSKAIASREHLTPELLQQARTAATRAAAIDTGAIEDLYTTDRGFTYTVAFETTAWDARLLEKGEQVRSLFEAQLNAYDYVLDLATSSQPFSEAAIRHLHEVVCAAQDSYRVVTAAGPQVQPLPKGQYKSLPNHVRTRRGEDHSYAPVDVTPAEMARLMVEIRSEAFQTAHPVRQAAYIHYCLVVIHPFSDGNGRVARALASAFTYKAASMPIVILLEHKVAYLDSLEDADAGNYASFENFMLARCLDTLRLIEDSLLTANSGNADAALASIESLYFTKGGYTQEQLLRAAKDLLVMVQTETDRVFKSFAAKSAKLTGQAGGIGVQQETPTHRAIGGFRATLTTKAPAQAQADATQTLLMPKNAGSSDDYIVSSNALAEPLSVRVDEIIPTKSGLLEIRAALFAERLLNVLTGQLAAKAKQNVKW